MTAEIDLEDTPRVNIVVNICRKLSGLVQIEVEPVGKWFHAHELARLRTHSTGTEISEDGSSDGEDGDSDEPEVEIKDDINFLRSLDPAEWKNQDHYAVLGLKNYRYKASDDDIKKAYRMMVLKHHPDKRRGAGEEIREDDDYFTCITKAYEILGVPSKRISYDSVDPDFDDSIPSVATAKKYGFFETYCPVVERNVRWSTRKHVPLLGKLDDPKHKVEKFYNFWYDFDSWREFSYLDEEEKEKGQDREERRWIEKQNKAERARRRKEEMARIRKLVENCYSLDPRIVKFREEEKERKAAAKKAKQDAIRQRVEQERKVQMEEKERLRKLKEKEEAELKAKQEAEKKQKEAAKKLLKKERKTFRTLCTTGEYFTSDPEEKVQIMTDVEFLCEALKAEQLRDLSDRLEAKGQDKTGAKDIIVEEMQIIKEKTKVHQAAFSGSKSQSGTPEAQVGKKWSTEDIQILIKAVNLFPAGTSKRWEVVAEYINQHSSSGHSRQAKEVLNKAKELQTSDQQIRDAAKQNAFQASEKNASAVDASQCSIRLETPQEMLGVNLTPWGADEQKLLEQALKTFSGATPDRWDKIADCVPNRSKKECMKRYKELVEMVKAKKAAAEAAASKR